MRPAAAILLAVAWFPAVLTGCGDTEPTARPDELPAVDLEAPRAGRAVVATVDGLPIYDSCVADQAAAAGMSKEQALDACIEFELLARVAHRRYGTDPEVHETRRQEAVRTLIERDFVPTADEPSDVPPKWLENNLWKRRNIQTFFNYPENRVTAYALAKFDEKMVDPALDAKTRALAERWHRALAARPDLSIEEFERIVRDIAEGHDVPFDFNPEYQTPLEGRSVAPFAEATFALDVGELSPVVKSRFGYFVILLRRVIPAKSTTFEEAVPTMQEKIFEQWRSVAFGDYMEALVEDAEVETFEGALAKVRLDLPSQPRLPEK